MLQEHAPRLHAFMMKDTALGTTSGNSADTEPFPEPPVDLEVGDASLAADAGEAEEDAMYADTSMSTSNRRRPLDALGCKAVSCDSASADEMTRNNKKEGVEAESASEEEATTHSSGSNSFGSNGKGGSINSLRGTSAFAGHRKTIFAVLIFLMGACAAAAFLYNGIVNAKNVQTAEFDQVASEFIVELEDAFKDYELFGLWIKESCRKKSRTYGETSTPLGICSRQDFRELYEYIESAGLDFQSAQYMPYVPRDQRAVVEAEAQAFYEENYPHVNYRGIVGLFPKEGGGLTVEPQEERDFYWPVHYIEPVLGNEKAIDLDLYSSPSQKKTIEHSVNNWLPSITDRLKLVQETEDHAYAIILHHPGIRLSTHNATADKYPSGISLMVIRIPALLARTSVDAKDSATYYLFDETHADQEPVFLGANTVYVQPHTKVVSTNSLPEISLEQLQEDLKGQPKTRLELRRVDVADRKWVVAVVSLPGTFEPDFVFVMVGGVIIIVASLILSTCFWGRLQRAGKLHAIKQRAAQEKARIIVESARQQALIERNLNDFIAHEVRNPLSSAMAALSFVSAATEQPRLTDEEKHVMCDDLHIIDSSLQLINELLRDMLELHRATDQQITITKAPTDILRDVLEPVAGILYMRGSKVQVITECPPNMIVQSDKLRLKQIVLNLAMNSTKFVTKGFVRLKCSVKQGSGPPSVMVEISDSGPGIPPKKRANIFAKFQESLDLLQQGTGIGLCLCKKMSILLKADLWLDESYDSGIEGCPGSRFILDLHTPPIDDSEHDQNYPAITLDLPSAEAKVSGLLTDPEKGECSVTVRSVVDTQQPAGPQQIEKCETAETQRNVPDTVGKSDEEHNDNPSSTAELRSPGGQDVENSNHQSPRPSELPEELDVLFVDDDRVLRKLFSRSLRRVAPGWRVQEAADGESALEMVDTTSFDVIFLDQYMSSIEKHLLGTDTATALRAKGVKSIICGLSANDTEELFLDAGADYFLLKPFPCEKETLKRTLLGVIYGPSRKSEKTVTTESELT